MPRPLPPLTRQALLDSARARHLYRVARGAERNARRAGDTDAADRWKEIAKRWLRAHQNYHRAHEYFLRFELAQMAGGTPRDMDGNAGDLARAAAESMGRSADALQLAREQDVQAGRARQAGDTDTADKHDRRAARLRAVAEKWKAAAAAYWDAKLVYVGAFPSPEDAWIMQPDEAAIAEAEAKARRADRLYMAAADFHMAEEAEWAAEDAEGAGDSDEAARLRRCAEKWRHAGRTWEDAAGEEGRTGGSKESAEELDEAARERERSAGALGSAAETEDDETEARRGFEQSAEEHEQAARHREEAARALREGDPSKAKIEKAVGETVGRAGVSWRGYAHAREGGFLDASSHALSSAKHLRVAAESLQAGDGARAKTLTGMGILTYHAGLAARVEGAAGMERADVLLARSAALETDLD